ncbi:MAG: DoxX family protein [Chloroflexi bacterium]|nr:DoxX family protein [Chloroflexota bacterium]
MPTMKPVLRLVLALCMVGAGVMHFLAPQRFIRTVPEFLPAAPALVIISGVFEILGGFGLLVPLTRRWAAWGLVALYAAVVPANLNMAVNRMSIGGKTSRTWPLWGRIPLQGLLIGWAYWYTRSESIPDFQTD